MPRGNEMLTLSLWLIRDFLLQLDVLISICSDAEVIKSSFDSQAQGESRFSCIRN